MCYSLFFGFLAATLTAIAYALLFDYVEWPPYLSWLVAVSTVTFLMYGVDRVLNREGKAEMPELPLHLLSAAGGFAGAAQFGPRRLFSLCMYRAARHARDLNVMKTA